MADHIINSCPLLTHDYISLPAFMIFMHGIHTIICILFFCFVYINTWCSLLNVLESVQCACLHAREHNMVSDRSAGTVINLR